MPPREPGQVKGYTPPGGKPLPQVDIGPSIRLSGVANDTLWQGSGVDTSGNMVTWTATFIKAALQKAILPGKKNHL